MPRRLLIPVILPLIAALAATTTRAQANLHSARSVAAGAESGQTVDGIAARIEDDILTESEVTELAAFQTLVDGQSKPREEIIRELADQWIVRGEASATQYPEPSAQDVDNAYAQLEKQFPSGEEFLKRCVAAGLAESAVRRLLAQQLYLSRFLDFRFRPAAQVDDQQVDAYYKNDFVPQLQKRGEPVPPLDDVDDTIREVLVQRAINDRATAWLDETRERLQIDVMSPENKR
jgi:hypothetical protein